MNLRFGIDLASVRSIEQNLADHGVRYLERIYTPKEIVASGGPDRIDPRRLAERFAMKEATLKVLPAADEGLDFRSIELLGDRATDQLRVALHGRAAELAAASRIARLAVSVSSDDRLAAAAVVAEIADVDPASAVSPR